MKPEGYTITPGANSLTLSAATATGLFYAAQTLKQLILNDGAKAVVQTATIRDWPAMKYRGVHDDLSRGPIPTLAFQKEMIRNLAAYKVNLYSPYFEHTQQYASNPLFAPPGGSISASDARELVAYAAQYHVTIVPEQEAFGHLHHNLTWEQYQPLAETPHGDVLAPGQPGSLTLIDQMFTELAGLYPGPFLHIGADETQNLGLGQTKSDVDTRGLGPVYTDFMQKIVASLQPLHRRILFWGDIAQTIVQGGNPYGVAGPERTDPQILIKLPAAFKQETIAVAWQYNPEPKGFAKYLTPFTSAGFETWVSPGVNNWSRVWPDDNDALPNIQQFIAEGQRQHSTGALNTIWYDDGEALANNNWYGLLFGAAASWQSGVSSIEAFQHGFGEVFHGDSTGALDQAQIELMKCHDILRNEAKVGDGSDGLFWMDPWSKDGQLRAAKLRPVIHEMRLHAEAAIILIAQARAAYPPQNLSSFREAGGSASSGANPGAPPSSTAPSSVRVGFDPATALPSNPTSLRHPDAIDALELGARRLDFIGLKFQLADEIAADYQNALIAQATTDKKIHQQVGADLNDISSFIGRIRDIRDTYALLRDLYQQAWLRSNRPYALRPILAHYDDEMSLWQSRSDRFRAAQRQLTDSKTLPTAADVGLPPK
jgi:hexosaminidase